MHVLPRCSTHSPPRMAVQSAAVRQPSQVSTCSGPGGGSIGAPWHGYMDTMRLKHRGGSCTLSSFTSVRGGIASMPSMTTSDGDDAPAHDATSASSAIGPIAR